MEIKVKKGQGVKLYKLSDDVFEGFHPNLIDEGYTQVGILTEDVEIGKRCNVQGRTFHDWLTTSTVTNIIDEETFKTKNSTYKITPYEYN